MYYYHLFSITYSRVKHRGIGGLFTIATVLRPMRMAFPVALVLLTAACDIYERQ